MYAHLDYQGPKEFQTLRQLYWHLRFVRKHDAAARRKWYRRIRSERDRLETNGHHPEHLRLFCRYMANPAPDTPALERLWAFDESMHALGRIASHSSRIRTEQKVISS